MEENYVFGILIQSSEYDQLRNIWLTSILISSVQKQKNIISTIFLIST